MGEFALYPHRQAAEPVMTAGKPLALLAYLALAPGRTADRDRLGQLLWPGADPPERHHSLRQCRYRLRSATGKDPLISQNGAELELSPCIGFDCLEGEAAGDPETAYRLLRGVFLPGFSIPESHEFEEWADAQRARFGQRWASAALALAEATLESGDTGQSLEIAEEVAAARPFDDEPVHLIMRSLAVAGRVATSLSRYAAYSDLLAAQGYTPEEALTAYADELSALARERSERPRREMPFVGRSAEWATLEHHWEATGRGEGAVILVEGGAGLGKSRLVRELQARARAAGGLVLSAKCYEPEIAVPYAAVSDALAPAVPLRATAALPPPWLAELAKLLPEVRELGVEIPDAIRGRPSPAAKRRLHQAVLRLLSAVSADAPVVLAIDDVQWADPASLEVIHFLARKVDRKNVLIVATYRPAELTPDARRLTRSLASARLAGLLVLEPLRKEDIADLLDRAGAFESREAADAVPGQLYRVSGGNPLFLEELLDALDRERILFVRDGAWSWGGAESERHLPRTISKLLADRIEVLDPGTRACLELAAVVADDVAPETLANALDLSEPRTDLALLILEDNRLIRRLETGDFAIGHDELRRMVYQMIPDDRRRTLHGSVARVLEARGEAKRPGGTARLAYHYEQASERRKARHYALEAAREASALSAEDQGRTQRQLAAALAERPAAPGKRGAGAGPGPWAGRWGPAAMVGLILVLGVLGAFLVWPEGMDSDFRQGTLYLTSSQGGRQAQVVWTAEAGEVRTAEASRPDGEADLLVRPVSYAGETHDKVFAAGGQDTLQLTTGLSDDILPTWAPDRGSIYFIRGWRAADDLYTANVFRMDPRGRIREHVTRTTGQDATMAVSPLGTALAVNRDSAGVSSILVMDVDGSHSWNLSEQLALPRVRANPAFSPDGARIALAYRSGTASDLYVVDLRGGHARKIFTAAGTSPTPRLAWSPDGRWIALARRRDGLQVVTIVPANGGTPVEVDAGGLDVHPGPWEPDPPYVDRVEIAPRGLDIATGSGHPVVVAVLGPRGETLPAERIRYAVLDTTVARVDDGGYVVGRSPGSTTLIASAGGFRADTVNVSVSYAAVDTLFVETWAGGLDTVAWRPFGHPHPKVVETGFSDRPLAFLNNGDYNHGSGAISADRFDAAEEGLTIDVDAWIPLTYDHWQHWQVGLVAGEPRYFADNEFGSFTGQLAIDGDVPLAGSPRWVCSDDTGRSNPVGPWTPPDRWIRFSLQLRPDGRLECFQDGRLLGAVDLSSSVPLQDVAIGLRGLSVGAQILHGPVVVTRGLRY